MDATLVGREDVLAELDAAARAAANGVGGLVLLTGEAGIGKTSAARAAAALARDRMTVTWGRCSIDRGAPPFWPWEALLGADTVAPRAAGPAEPAIGAERFEQLSHFRTLVVEHARKRPTVHVLEDLQWADVASVLLLNHVAASIDDVPLLLVATLRTGEPLAAPLADALVETQRLARTHPLSPLTEDDIAALMNAIGVTDTGAVASSVLTRTGGNPLFVTEVLRATRLGDHVPTRVSELVADRLRRLPADVADTLVSAAVLGDDGDVATLAAVSGVPIDTTLDRLEPAQAARLIEEPGPGRWHFRHALVRDAIYASASTGVRARRHADVLEVLAADPGTPPPALAHHALAALPLLDPGRAVTLAGRAGEAAFAQHAYEEAAEWFERALAAAPRGTDDRWRAELLVHCGDAHRQSGAIEPARRAYLEATERAQDPELFARAALGYVDPGVDLGIAYRSDDPISGDLLERAIAMQPPGDSEVLALLEARRAAVLYFSDEPERARSMAYAALERAQRLDARHAVSLASALIHDAFVVGQCDLMTQLDGSQRLLALARESGSPAALLAAHRARVIDLLAAGDLAAMDAEIRAFRLIAEPLRVPMYDWWPALWSAMRELLEGRHERAEEQAVAALQIGETSFPSLAFLNFSFVLFFLRREQGRLAEMEQMTREMVASRADIPAIRVGLLFLLAELDRRDEVAGMLSSIDENELARLRDRNWPVTWFQLARAAFVVGDQRVAALLVRDDYRPSELCVMVSVGTVCLGATDLGAAWLHHVLGNVDAADACYAAAEATNARIGARVWLAQTRQDRATLGVAAAPEPTAHREARFVRANNVWEVEYGGRAATVAHSRGMSDLAYLLAHPQQAVSVLELADAPEPSTRGAEALDERARREIRRRLQELDEEEADADAMGDGERAALAREQRQLLAESVARDFGLGGKARRVDDPVERARKTVSTRIRRTIAAVARVHAELGRHLERSVDTGTWCGYRPAEEIFWKT